MDSNCRYNLNVKMEMKILFVICFSKYEKLIIPRSIYINKLKSGAFIKPTLNKYLNRQTMRQILKGHQSPLTKLVAYRSHTIHDQTVKEDISISPDGMSEHVFKSNNLILRFPIVRQDDFFFDWQKTIKE